MGVQDIIEFLKERPGKHFSLIEISEELHLAKGNAYRSVKSLSFDERIDCTLLEEVARDGKKRKVWRYAYKKIKKYGGD